MKKTFDCVKMMRDIRTKLSRRYRCMGARLILPELLERDLEEIHKKYDFPDLQRKPKAQLVAEGQAEYGSSKRQRK